MTEAAGYPQLAGGTGRLLCDEMLAGLGRWLRAAGYDTVLPPPGSHDEWLLEQTLAQTRLLLTRDRLLAQRVQGRGDVVQVAGNNLEACALELGRRLAINWLHRPFSRCLNCNTLLQTATIEQRSALPPAVCGQQDVRYCTCCDKLYWEGSHVRRMRQRLTQWNKSGGQGNCTVADTVTSGRISIPLSKRMAEG